MHIDHSESRIGFEVSEKARAAVASLGRTEDVKFSPGNQRLAIADHFRDKIVVFDLSIESGLSSKQITLTNAIEISSSYLKRPHGLDFIGDNTIIVANREGQICLFEIPAGGTGSCELSPASILTSKEISSPGSVAVSKNPEGCYEALICSDYTDKVSRHTLRFKDKSPDDDGQALLQKWIRFPDGICVSKKSDWIAVSNHDTHAVFVYKNDSGLNNMSNPDGILRHYYPHGLRFACDDRFLIATSAGSPYLNIYEAAEADWRGVRDPVLTIKVLSDEDFLRCRISREDGGPKGIDVNNDMDLMVVTCENQPLLFFDLQSILQQARSNTVERQESAATKSFLQEKFTNVSRAVKLKHQLYLGQITATCTKQIRWLLTRAPVLSWVLNWVRRRMKRPVIVRSY